MVIIRMKWIKRDDQEESGNLGKICPMCNTRYELDSNYCQKDGHRLILEEKAKTVNENSDFKCRACGYVNEPPLRGFCILCGEPFGSEARRERVFLFVEGIYPIYIESFPFELDRMQLSRLEGSEYVNSPHVRIVREGPDFYVKDMNSLNGTSLNGKIIGGKGRKKAEKERLFSGDVIEICLDSKNNGMIRMQFKVFPTLA